MQEMDLAELSHVEDTSKLGITESEMTQKNRILKKVQHIIFTFLAVCLIIELVSYTYLGSLLFLQVSLHQILHTFVCGLSNLCAGRTTEVIHVLIWCVSSLPQVAIVIGLDIQMLVSFFRNLSEFCNISVMRQYIENAFESRDGSRIPLWLRRTLCVICCCFLVIGVFGVLNTINEMEVTGVFYGIVAIGEVLLITGLVVVCFQPIIALFKIIFNAWKIMLCNKKSQDEDGNTGETQAVASENQDDNEQQPLAIFDPCHVRNPWNWYEFMESECNCILSFRRSKLDKGVITGGISLIVCISRLIMDIVLTKSSGFTTSMSSLIFNSSEYLARAGLSIRCICSIFMMPLVVSVNPGILFFKKEKMKKHRRVQQMMLISSVLHGLFIVGFVVGAIYMSFFFRPVVIQQYTPISQPESALAHNITSSQDAALCSLRIGNLSVIDFASVNVLASIRDDEVRHNVSLDLFPYFGVATDDANVRCNVPSIDGVYLRSDVFSMYRVHRAGDLHEVVGFESTQSGIHVGVLLEQIASYWLRRGLRGIVPLYELFDKRTRSMYHIAIQWLITAFQYTVQEYIGLRPVTALVNKQDIQEQVDEMCINGSVLHFTGHSSGGLLAKYFSRDSPWKTMTFESPVFDLLTSELKRLVQSEKGVINVYSPGSIFSMSDPRASLNIEMPSVQTFLNPANPYETFCELAAGCAFDSRYDHLCSSFVGPEIYQSYFAKWSRERSELEI